MIKLLSVIGAGGIPIFVKTYVDLKKEEALIYLIGCMREISKIIGGKEIIAIISFGENKLMVTESKKGYAIAVLADRPSEYIDIFLNMMRKTIDEGNIPNFCGYSDEILEGKIKDIAEKCMSVVFPSSILRNLSSEIARIDNKMLSNIVDRHIADYIFLDFPKTFISTMRTIKKLYPPIITTKLARDIGKHIWKKTSKTLQPSSMKDLKKIFSEFAVVGKTTITTISLKICPECIRTQANKPICVFMKGIIEGMFNNPKYEVIETKCIAKGDKECRFTIKEKTNKIT